MQQVHDACETAQSYPTNLVIHNNYQHNLKDYFNRLNEREKDLFRDKENSLVDFWDLDHKKGGEWFQPRVCTSQADSFPTGFYGTTIKSLTELKDHLWKDTQRFDSSPRCRFM